MSYNLADKKLVENVDRDASRNTMTSYIDNNSRLNDSTVSNNFSYADNSINKDYV